MAFTSAHHHLRPRLTKTALAVLGAVLALALLAGCGSSGSSATAKTTTAKAGAATIVIKNFAFQPGSLTVRPGEKVTVHNEDTATHTVTATGGAFSTGDVNSGATVTFVAPKKAGSYAYICKIHQFMHGTLVVS